MELQAEERSIFGVYSDFAEILGKLVGHAMAGPDPSPSLLVRSTSLEGRFRLEFLDEGGAILPERLATAFEPFTLLHAADPVLGMRYPGEGLPACAQILSAYQGNISIRNEGDGTLVVLELPLH
jgi:C4-dicarboxylate-specific signal transduction histidine kinase